MIFFYQWVGFPDFETIDFPNKIIFRKIGFETIDFPNKTLKNNFVRKINGFKTYFSKK